MKTALSILGSLLLCLPSHAQQSGYTLSYADNPPFSVFENGKAKGVAIDVVAKLFEKAKVGYKFQNVPLARGMEESKTSSTTCVFPVQRAQSNEAEYQWVSPIFVSKSALFVTQDSKVNLTTLSDAKKLSVGVLRGSGDADYLRGFGFAVQEVNSQDQNVKKLLGKQIDAWATDTLSADYFVQQAGEKQKAPKYALTFRKSLGSLACNTKVPKADIEKLQVALDNMIKDGTLEKLTSKVQ
jgi:polar amino acid transport system substrate-binding protein